MCGGIDIDMDMDMLQGYGSHDGDTDSVDGEGANDMEIIDWEHGGGCNRVAHRRTRLNICGRAMQTGQERSGVVEEGASFGGLADGAAFRR